MVQTSRKKKKDKKKIGQHIPTLKISQKKTRRRRKKSNHTMEEPSISLKKKCRRD